MDCRGCSWYCCISVSGSSCSNLLDDKMRDGNNERFEWPETITCHCKTSGNKSLLLVECRRHTISESTPTKENASPNAHLKFDSNFIFGDGVLVHMDPDKDVSFHCKFETLCLCSLIELIVMSKQPFHWFDHFAAWICLPRGKVLCRCGI